LRVDAVKALQQRWQAEAQGVPLDRKQEQKLWDAFRKPIDEAFNRKGEERGRAAAALSDRDRAVLDASKALETANADGDAQKIRAAMAGLDAALRGQAQAAAAVKKEDEEAAARAEIAPAASAAAPEAAPEGEGAEPAATEEATAAPAAPAPKAPPKPVIAMRGDDRPGMKKAEPAAPGRGGKFGDRKGAPGGRFGDKPGDRGGRGDARGGRFGDREQEDRGPRLGDAAFRAQRDALEHAQSTLKKLAAQAHGEALTQLLTAWEKRAADQVPSQSELGKSVTPSVRGAWAQALGAAPAKDAGEALLRLEIAAEVPTPADQISARRLLQLQLLTKRNDPSPAQTWGQDAARVLGSAHEPQAARRLQNVLKVLLRD
jgi:ATP-dependent RNA helicase SUPV3L1/SUV3